MNERYQRHIQLHEIGSEGQQKIGNAKVLVVGAGGLGCPVLQYLVAAGVGKIGIVDFDIISISNLQRQILYNESDIGLNKAYIAKKRLNRLNSEIEIQAYEYALTIDNCLDLVAEYDVVIDGTDNFTTRYLLNDACVKLATPLIHGSLYKFEGQVSVFNYKNGPSYRCLFPNPPKANEVPNCNEIGVLGVLPGIIGIFLATEALKIILNLGDVLSGKMMYYNALDHSHKTISFSRNEEIIATVKKGALKMVDTADCFIEPPISLQQLNPSDGNNLWIDVRDAHEQPRINIEHMLRVPMDQFKEKIGTIESSKRKIIFCQSGNRALLASQWAKEGGISNCVALREGAATINEWLKTTV